MNILFISFDADPPYMGGVATVINIIAKEFLQRGHNVYLGYYTPGVHPSLFFKNKIQIASNNIPRIKEFNKSHKIDIIYNALPLNADWSTIKTCFPTTKIVSAYHSRPQLNYFPLYSLMNIYYNSNNILYKIYTLLKIPILPIQKIKSQRREKREFSLMVQNSDRILLLSPHFYPCIKRIIPSIDNRKLAAIPNPVVFNSILSREELKDKKNKVLVVASSNHVKRIWIILHIWKEIEKDNQYNMWSLDIVGEGEDYIRLQSLAKRLKLKRITFYGYKKPEPFYQEASIFLMTSKYEGWPMVLMECMQKGVVPIVYNSFESLTDIITDNINGFIIPNNDFHLFVNKLKFLMSDKAKRDEMANHGLDRCEQYSIEHIIDKFESLFTEVMHEERN